MRVFVSTVEVCFFVRLFKMLCILEDNPINEVFVRSVSLQRPDELEIPVVVKFFSFHLSLLSQIELPV